MVPKSTTAAMTLFPIRAAAANESMVPGRQLIIGEAPLDLP